MALFYYVLWENSIWRPWYLVYQHRVLNPLFSSISSKVMLFRCPLTLFVGDSSLLLWACPPQDADIWIHFISCMPACLLFLILEEGFLLNTPSASINVLSPTSLLRQQLRKSPTARRSSTTFHRISRSMKQVNIQAHESSSGLTVVSLLPWEGWPCSYWRAKVCRF